MNSGVVRLGLMALILTGPFAPVAGQAPSGREVVESLTYEPLDFSAEAPDEYAVQGVPVLVLAQHDLPLVSIYARFRGGYSTWGRQFYGVGTGLPAQLRYGGTVDMPADSVDELLEYYALQTSFGGSGEVVSSTINSLTEYVPRALDLWGDMLIRPRFDEDQIAVWRGRELESVRRRLDDPSRLAFSEFNRLLYGDHPIGWEMTEDDLAESRLTRDRFHELHRRVVCRENLILGVTGDVQWDTLRPVLDRFVAKLAPCEGDMPESPIPDIRREPGVYVIEKDLEQSVIVMAHPTTVRLADDPIYFAATIGNSILGAGGFSSRILSRVRTEEGFAYSASSLWTMPRRYDGIIGALTRTRPENTVPAIRVILDAMAELKDEAPATEEVETAVERIVNGFVFNFETAGQIVSRTMFYMAIDLPQDWLQRYLAGVQGVTAESVHRVMQSQLRPDDMMILIVGDPDRIGRDALEALGPITVLEVR